MKDLEVARSELAEIAKRSVEMNGNWIVSQVLRVGRKYPSVNVNDLYAEIIHSLD